MLKLFLLAPNQVLHVREITRRVGAEINAVRRELNRLTKIRMLKREERGNRVYYRFREDFPFRSELVGLLAKEEGLGKKILENAKELGKVKYAVLNRAFLSGRIAKRSEVDLLIVGNVPLNRLADLIRDEEKKLGHEINYTVMGEEEFNFRKKRRDNFIIDVLIRPYIILIGDELDFARLPSS